MAHVRSTCQVPVANRVSAVDEHPMPEKNLTALRDKGPALVPLCNILEVPVVVVYQAPLAVLQVGLRIIIEAGKQAFPVRSRVIDQRPTVRMDIFAGNPYAYEVVDGPHIKNRGVLMQALS